jgi:hypothetical protein
MHFYISCTLLGLLALVECMYHFLLTPRQWYIILTEACDAVAQIASSCCHPQRVFVGASRTWQALRGFMLFFFGALECRLICHSLRSSFFLHFCLGFWCSCQGTKESLHKV